MYINNSNFERLLQNNMEKMSKVTNQLSNGKRINRAADDASGLQISTRMTSQIRGSKQATRNIQDGISLLQTADGSLTTIQDMLQRMKELAVQGRNGTYSIQEKESIENEIQSLIIGINKVSENTNFNGISILSGGKSINYNGLKTENQRIQLQNIPVDTTPGAKTTLEFWMYWEGLEQGAGVQYPVFWSSNYNIEIYGGHFGLNTGNSDILGVQSEQLKNSWNHISLSYINGVPNATNTQLYINGEKQSLSYRPGGNNFAYSRNVSGTLDVGGTTAYLERNFNGKIDELKIWNGSRTEEEVKESMLKNENENEEKLLGYWKFDDETLKDETKNGNNGQFVNEVNLSDGISQIFSIRTGSEVDSKDDISTFAISSETLNIKGISLNEPDIIKKIDNAINVISLQRANIGSKINRYEFKLDNQQNLINNTESAKMRIEDQDMASAMSELTKEEILMSSIQRMMNISNSNYEQQMKMLLS